MVKVILPQARHRHPIAACTLVPGDLVESGLLVISGIKVRSRPRILHFLMPQIHTQAFE